MTWWLRDRQARDAKLLAGIAPDIRKEVGQLTDPDLIREARSYTPLTPHAFHEDVLCLNIGTAIDILEGYRRLPALVRRWLLIEVARQRQRHRDGILPEGTWCPHCGRGTKKGPATAIYIQQPDADALFRMARSED